MEYHSAIKRTTAKHSNVDESQKHGNKGIKSDTGKYILCDSICMKFQERHNESKVSERRSVVVWGRDGVGKEVRRSFWG